MAYKGGVEIGIMVSIKTRSVFDEIQMALRLILTFSMLNTLVYKRVCEKHSLLKK